MRNVLHIKEENIHSLTDNFNSECLFVVSCANRLDGKMAFQPKMIRRTSNVCFICSVHELRDRLDKEEVTKLCRVCARAEARQMRIYKKPQLFIMVRKW